jgi:hypothetical protein
MFASQAVIYALVAMNIINGYYLFLVSACYLLACYGGGFATIPAFCADSFGPGYIGKCYGFMLTAWACAGITGRLYSLSLAGQQHSMLPQGYLLSVSSLLLLTRDRI